MFRPSVKDGNVGGNVEPTGKAGKERGDNVVACSHGGGSGVSWPLMRGGSGVRQGGGFGTSERGRHAARETWRNPFKELF